MSIGKITRMVLCEFCGNKRCPHAKDQRYRCTGSNSSNQIPELATGPQRLTVITGMSREQLANLRAAAANCQNDGEARMALQDAIVRSVYEESWTTLHKLGQCLLDCVESERPKKFVGEGPAR